MLIQINTEEIAKLVADGDKIFLSPDGEAPLVELLKLQKTVEEAIDITRKQLEETALAINPNFSSIQGDKVKVYYRKYGSQYTIDPSHIAELPEKLYKTQVKYSANKVAIEEFLKEHGGLPLGINEPERTKQLSITLKGSKESNNE